MKKIVYLFASLMLVFASCNSVDDLDAELEARTKLDGIVGDVTYKFTPEDYTTKKSEGGFFEFSNEYFTSIEDVETMMPAFISRKFPALGAKFTEDGKIAVKSLAVVTYNLKNAVDVENYTLTAADYTAINLTSLNSSADFNKALKSKFAGVDPGTIVELTYKTDPPVTNYTLNNADYTLVGNGRFNNFDIRTGKGEETVDARRLKIQTILLNNFPTAKIGDIYKVTYAAFNDAFETVNLDLDVVFEGDSRVTNYKLTDADFALVGNGQFNNFDIRAGKPEETIESRRAKIETIITKNFPNAANNSIFNVTYAVWVPGDEERTTAVVKNGAKYELFTGTITPPTYELYTFALVDGTMRFAFNNGDWDAPKTFTAADYTAMGQRFPNFGDRETAEYNIAIYLKTLYPFATPDTFLPVEFEQFRAGKVNVNFKFDGTNWVAIQEVFETTAQFSHNGKTWKFDNTIKYTLTQADYDLVGNGRFANFDVRAGKTEETVAQRLAKINTILLNNFPGAKEAQKYSVSYNVWKPGDDVFVMNVIKEGTSYRLQTDAD
ncbi:MAG: hypothetical protein AB8B78_02420 [Polaribacter sp.]